MNESIEDKSRPAKIILSPHFVRLVWTFGSFPDTNRQSLREACRVVVDMLDEFRRSGYDHTPFIKSIAVGDHREGSERQINLQELYRIAGVSRQMTMQEF